ncbi:MAG: DNA-formamidopyrimidine glycosylase [Gammaproteobacteria bacterium]|nr:MAG: DNA-formamidopyrimidine glycosylase [Gammaproteobacteria bacterium]
MPELPEVETAKRAIVPYLLNNTIQDINILFPKLRLPIDTKLKELEGSEITFISRRAKYIIITTQKGSILLHLGMSGSLLICKKNQNIPLKKHDHFEIVLNNKTRLRLNDPRRFGLVLYVKNKDIQNHKLLKNLAPEPLTDSFNDNYLQNICQKSEAKIKNILMNNKLVVGVGNIYANEVLFESKIHPETITKNLNKKQIKQLTKSIKTTLKQAIKAGGTTLKDFTNPEGGAGYFSIQLKIYGKTDEPCSICSTKIKKIITTQRASFYCSNCQKK